MTELRDVRFQKALQAAPDADARAPTAIAETIRAAARSAAAQPQGAKAARAPWWQRVWAGTGQPRGPWGAALATVVLGVVVTTLWIDKPMPESQPQLQLPPDIALDPAPAPALAPSIAETPAVRQADKTSKPAAPVAPAAAPVVRDAREASQERAAAREQSAEAPAMAVVPTSADRLEQAAPLVGAVPIPSPAAPAPPVAATKAESMAAARAPAAVAAAPMAKRAAPEPKPAAPEPKPDAVDIAQPGQTLAADANMAQRLYALVQNLEAQAVAEGNGAGAEGASRTPLVLVFLMQGQRVLTFTLVEGGARWERPGREPIRAMVSEAQAAQLLQAVREAQEAQAAEPAR